MRLGVILKLNVSGYITEAFFSDLNRFGFANASDVVIGGCSAGAIRVYAHLDALKALAPSNARVVGAEWPENGG